MPSQTIIIDCDPGIDDAVALLLALASPDELDLLAVTAVCGNVSLDLTERNARRVLALAARPEVPVYPGAGRPIMIAHHGATVHGDDGLGGVPLPEPASAPQQRGAVDYLLETLAGRPGEISLCCLGPLSNPGLATVQRPEILRSTRQVVLMGGAAGRGNVTPHAEFNFHVDPHAAQLVLRSGAEVVMLGLDVTRQAPITEARLRQLAAVETAAARAAHDMLAFYGQGDTALHDPCVIAYLLRPQLFSGRRCWVDVETLDEERFGQSRVQPVSPYGQRQANALVIDRVDADGLFELLCERLARLP